MRASIHFKEAVFVAVVMIVPFFFARTFRLTEIIAACAVFITFLHAQMGNRMQEANAAQARPAIRNGWRIILYQVMKEGLWVVYFSMTHAWAALMGAVVFFCYPFWRKWYRARHPLKIKSVRDV